MIKKFMARYRFVTKHPLCNKRIVYFVIKFILFQLRKLFIKKELIVNWVNETKFSLSKVNTGLTANYYCGFIEFEDMLFLLHYLRKDDLFIDVGANIGAYTLLASGVIGAKSHSYEPVESTVELLINQIKLNNLEDLVSVNNLGIGSNEGMLFFTNNTDRLNHVVLINEEVINLERGLSSVKVATLDRLYSLQSPTVIKIDVEGFESFVIEGGESFFSNSYLTAIIVELNGLGEKYGRFDADIDLILRNYGFKSIHYNPINRKIIETSSFNLNNNTVYVRDIEETIERCITAEKVLVRTANNIQI